MPIVIKPVGARGGPRGAMEAEKHSKELDKIAKGAFTKLRDLSDKDISRVMSIMRGFKKPKKKEASGGPRGAMQGKKAGGKVKKK
jgi:hypothetical protein